MPSRSEVIWLAVLALVAAGGRLVVAVSVQGVVDGGAMRIVAAAVAALALALLASALLNRRLARITEDAVLAARVRALDAVHAGARVTRAGDVVSALTSDGEAVSVFVASGGIQLVVNVAQMLVAIVAIAWYSWQLAAVVIGVSAVLIAGLTAARRLVARRFSAARGSVGGFQARVSEMLGGMEVIASTGGQAEALARLDAGAGRIRDSQRGTLWPLHSSTAFGEMAISTITALVLLLGTAGAVGSVGDLVAVLLLVTFFVRPLQGLVQNLGDAQSALAGWRRLAEVARLPRPAGDEPLPAGPVDVELRGVSGGYGDGPDVLRDVSVRIRPGEHVAVVGRSGAGKSTFAQLVTRQLTARSGRVLLSGVPIEQLDEASLRRKVAVVPQDPFCFDDTVGANIAVAVPEGTPPDVVPQHVGEVLRALELDGWVAGLPHGLRTPSGPGGSGLSVGERQLVALARAALADPDLLVLDEATSAIEPAIEKRLQRAVARLTRGRTTITIAHRSSAVEAADRVITFASGRVADAELERTS